MKLGSRARPRRGQHVESSILTQSKTKRGNGLILLWTNAGQQHHPFCCQCNQFEDGWCA